MSCNPGSVALRDLCAFSSERVKVSDLGDSAYISTESMAPDLGPVSTTTPPQTGSVSKFCKDDILFANIRPYFRKVWLADCSGGCSVDVLVVRALDTTLIHQHYLYYLLADKKFIDYSMTTAKGAKMPRGDKGAMLEYKISLPDMATQMGVVRVLKSLDDLVADLRLQNQVLESSARSLFKCWFIDFEPVKLKREGGASLGMEDRLLSLFPVFLEEVDGELLPKGWKPSCLSSLVNLNAISWTNKEHPDEISYFELTSVKSNNFAEPILYKFDDAPSRARRVVKPGDTIFGTVRPGNLSYGLITQDLSHLTVSTGFAVLSPKERHLSAFVYCAATEPTHVINLTRLAEGAAFPAVHPDLVTSKTLALPDDPRILEEFGKITNPMFELIGENRRTIDTLIGIREELLPRLISGKLRVEEAEEALAAAVPILTLAA